MREAIVLLLDEQLLIEMAGEDEEAVGRALWAAAGVTPGARMNGPSVFRIGRAFVAGSISGRVDEATRAAAEQALWHAGVQTKRRAGE